MKVLQAIKNVTSPLCKNLRIMRVRGIDISLHWTFIWVFGLLLVINFIPNLLFGNSVEKELGHVWIIFLVFTSVVVHELAHSFEGMRLGYTIRSILLTPIGGMAGFSELPRKPSEEFRITVAGPLSNIVLLVIFGLFYKATGWSPLKDIIFVNTLLAIFNLVPCFPMDGGRIFRSILAKQYGIRVGTDIAVRYSYAFIILFVFIAFTARAPNLCLIAGFILLAGKAEQSHIHETFSKYARNVANDVISRFNSSKCLVERTEIVLDMTKGPDLNRASKCLLMHALCKSEEPVCTETCSQRKTCCIYDSLLSVLRTVLDEEIQKRDFNEAIANLPEDARKEAIKQDLLIG